MSSPPLTNLSGLAVASSKVISIHQDSHAQGSTMDPNRLDHSKKPYFSVITNPCTPVTLM